jgi:hypothetical protein
MANGPFESSAPLGERGRVRAHDTRAVLEHHGRLEDFPMYPQSFARGPIAFDSVLARSGCARLRGMGWVRCVQQRGLRRRRRTLKI